MTGHRESLRPPWWLWVLLLPLLAVTALTSTLILGAEVAVAVSVAMTLAAAVLALVTSPSVVVDAAGLHAGGALLERGYVGTVLALEGSDARAELGPRMRADAFVVHRFWARGLVRVEVADPSDSTPYWLVSSSNPSLLASALQSLREDAGGAAGQAAHSEQTGWPPSE